MVEGEADGDEAAGQSGQHGKWLQRESCGCARSLHPLSNGTENRKHYVVSTAKLECGFPMTPAARISAAIEVLADIEARRRPAAGRPEGLGPVPPLRRLQGPGRHREPRLRRPAPEGLRRLDHGRGHAPRRACSACCACSAASTPEAIAALCSGERFAPEPLSRRRARAARDRPTSTAPRPLSPATSRTGSSRRSSASSATTSCPRCRRSPPARPSTCG